MKKNLSSFQEEIPFSVTWSIVLEKMREKQPPSVSHWLQPLKLVHQDAKSITLVANSPFDKNWVQNNFVDLISDTIDEIYKRNLEIKVISPEENKELAKSVSNSSSKKQNIALTSFLNPRYSFDNFVVGPSNQFAQAASYAVASAASTQEERQTHNPLFIYGGVGLGKTHLINAIGNFAMEKSKGKLNVCFVTSEEFTNQVISGIKNNKMDEFHDRYRYGCDLLLIDDIQLIAGKESTQDVFFHTFNALYESNKYIVLTSDKPPNEMPKLQERISSRFEWGLTADIHPPEFETRTAILTQKAEQEGVDFPDDAKMFLAQHEVSNIRKLEGIFNNLVTLSKYTGKEINIGLVQQTIGTIKRDSKVTTVEGILKEVASHYDLKISDLKSPTKLKHIAVPRQVAMYLSRKYTVSSFPEIGEKIGGRDHSTIVHGYNKIEKKLDEQDTSLTRSVSAISKKIESQIT